MSTDPTPTAPRMPVEELKARIREYAPHTGADRYARFCEEIIDVQRTYVQDQILKSLHENKQTVVVAANGVGKSYIAAAGGLAALYCNPDTIVNVTAGNNATLKTNIWKPARSLFRNCDLLPGRTLDSSREIRTGLDDEWFFECVSPRWPDDLEGPHNDHVVYVVEEADKPGITADHIDSVRSTATDDTDRVLVICNPPRDESNTVYDLMRSEQWHTLEFSSWDSHNVRVERGIDDADMIPGLVKTSKIQDDWDEYHTDPWPGLEQAMSWSDPDSGEFRDDLDSRWYRRRAGVMPPDDASAHRPFYADDVQQAVVGVGDQKDRQSLTDPATSADPVAVGIDVARKGGDSTVVAVLYPETVSITRWASTDHNENEQRIRQQLDELPNSPRTAIDAVGEGSGVADRLTNRYPRVTRFKAGEKAVAEGEYYDRWSEGLDALGGRLSALTFDHTDLREEMFAASRYVDFTEKRRRSGDVLKATSKSELKEHLGRSPDTLDAVMMAAWAADAYTPVTHRTRRRPGGSGGRRRIER